MIQSQKCLQYEMTKISTKTKQNGSFINLNKVYTPQITFSLDSLSIMS